MENSLESKMKSVFQNSILQESNYQFYLQRLVYSENFNEINFLHRYKILLAILRCRGLLRTLLFLIPLTHNNNSELHLSKRMDIYRFLIRQRVIFFKKIVTKLKFVYVQPNHFHDAPLVNDLAQFNLKELSPHKGAKLIQFNIRNDQAPIYGNDNGTKLPKEEVLFHKLMFRDSHAVADFIFKKQMEDISKPYFTCVYPQFRLGEYGFVKAQVKVLPKYDQVLDIDLSAQFHSDYQKLQSVQIWHQRFIISKKKILIHDSTAHPAQKFVAGQWPFIKSFDKNDNSCLIKSVRGETKYLESGIFLSGRCDENWYHFIIDTVPRILFVNDIPRNVPLLIRSDIPENSKAVLASITDREITEIAPNEIFEVKNLYVIPGRSSVFDSTPPRSYPLVEFSPKALKKIRSLLLRAHAGVDENSGENAHPLTIALSRSSTTRNLQNSESIDSLLKNYGFTLFELNLSFFRDQIKTFWKARIVVAAGGAALANIIFMPKGSTVVVLRSWRNPQLNLWVNLARAMDVNCIEITGMPTYFGPGKLRRMHSDFYISPRKLRKVLASVIASIT
jgi:hypothetical protein